MHIDSLPWPHPNHCRTSCRTNNHFVSNLVCLINPFFLDIEESMDDCLDDEETSQTEATEVLGIVC